jgi:hypothetical protein
MVQGDGFSLTSEVVPGDVYVQANAEVLTSTLGLPVQDASLLSGWWLSLETADTASSRVFPSVTLGSLLEQLRLTGPFSSGGAVVLRGRKVVAVSGRTTPPGGTGPQTATLYISATSDPLPVELITNESNGGRLRATFSDWGQRASISAPTDAVPLADEGGGNYLPVPAASKLPPGLCDDTLPPDASQATQAYVATTNALVPQWTAITRSLGSRSDVAQPQDFMAEADTDQQFLAGLEKIRFPGQLAALATNLEMYVREYVDQLQFVLHQGPSAPAISRLDKLDSAESYASELLRGGLGLGPSYCEWLRPSSTGSPRVAVHSSTDAALPGQPVT